MEAHNDHDITKLVPLRVSNMTAYFPSTKRAVVLVKDVPAGGGLIPLGPDHRVQRHLSPTTMSGIDIFAVGAAQNIANEVIAVTMGADRATGTLREALSLGADRALHLSDSRLQGSNASDTARVLAAIVERLGPQVVLLGRESSDARLGVLPGMMAEILDWNLITAADEIHTEGNLVRARVRADRTTTSVSSELPAIISVAEYGATPRTVDIEQLQRAFLTPIETWTLNDVSVSREPSPVTVETVIDLTVEREMRIVRKGGAKLLKDEISAVKGSDL